MGLKRCPKCLLLNDPDYDDPICECGADLTPRKRPKRDHVVFVQDHEAGREDPTHDLPRATKIFGPLTQAKAKALEKRLYEKHEGTSVLVVALKLRKSS